MDEKTVTQVKKSIRKWPAYRKFIESRAIDPLKIERISDLPIIDKHFLTQAIYSVPLFRVRNIVPSSGSTGPDFSFGLFGEDEMKKASVAVDAFLEDRFRTNDRKTLLLNLLPGAICIRSATASVASIGVRTDTAISAIKALGSSFEQIILVGEPIFIKNLIESGAEQSVLWNHMPLFIIVGGEWISETYRNYLEGITGYNRIYSSLGMAELGLNYFYETEETVRLRRLLFRDSRLGKALFGGIDFCPMLFSYNEEEIYIETVRDAGEDLDSILLTTVNPGRVLPLIRYRSGDRGKILTIKEINAALSAGGYAELPGAPGSSVLAHFGRGEALSAIHPEEIKDILYCFEEIASSTTGLFILSRNREFTELKVQLRGDVPVSPSLTSLYRAAFHKLPVRVTLCPFGQFPYPLDFERKVRYIDESDHCTTRSGKEVELSAAV